MFGGIKCSSRFQGKQQVIMDRTGQKNRRRWIKYWRGVIAYCVQLINWWTTAPKQQQLVTLDSMSWIIYRISSSSPTVSFVPTSFCFPRVVTRFKFFPPSDVILILRWKHGIAASLAYVSLDSDNSLVHPYPSWEANTLPVNKSKGEQVQVANKV